MHNFKFFKNRRGAVAPAGLDLNVTSYGAKV